MLCLCLSYLCLSTKVTAHLRVVDVRMLTTRVRPRLLPIIRALRTTCSAIRHTDTTSPPEHCCVDAARPSDILLLLCRVLRWSFAACCVLISENQQRWGVAVIGVQVFERAVCSLGIEEVDGRDEGEVEDDPDNVELPAKGLDADRGYFHYYEVAHP